MTFLIHSECYTPNEAGYAGPDAGRRLGGAGRTG